MKILETVKSYRLSHTNKTDEALIKMIKRNEDLSFVIAYRLLEGKLQNQKNLGVKE